MWTVTEDAVPKDLADRAAKSLAETVLLLPQKELRNKTLQSTQPHLAVFSTKEGGESVPYFHTTLTSHPFTKELHELAVLAQKLAKREAPPTLAYVNVYTRGKCIPYHRDTTHANRPIVSFTLYPDEKHVPRRFSIRCNKTGEVTHIMTTHGQSASVRHEVRGMQETHEHGVLEPAETTRVNVTFRYHS